MHCIYISHFFVVNRWPSKRPSEPLSLLRERDRRGSRRLCKLRVKPKLPDWYPFITLVDDTCEKLKSSIVFLTFSYFRRELRDQITFYFHKWNFAIWNQKEICIQCLGHLIRCKVHPLFPYWSPSLKCKPQTPSTTHFHFGQGHPFIRCGSNFTDSS